MARRSTDARLCRRMFPAHAMQDAAASLPDEPTPEDLRLAVGLCIDAAGRRVPEEARRALMRQLLNDY